MMRISDGSIHPYARWWGRFLLMPLMSAVTIVFLSLPVLAAGPPPGAGQMMKEIPGQTEPFPMISPGLIIHHPKNGNAPSTVTFRIEHILITGNTLFPTSRLHDLISSGEGKELTLAKADALADRITRFYHEHGYPLVRAYIPAQTIQNATLTISVEEARYGKISLNNLSRVNKSLLKATAAPLSAGKSIDQQTLNRSLLLMNDIPGVRVYATLSPGVKPESSDLTINTEPRPQFTGNVGVDDYGDQYTGRVRLTANLVVNNPLHWGDRLSFSGLTSTDRLSYGRMGYSSVVNGWGSVLGMTGSFLHYRLGDAFTDMGAHGDAEDVKFLARQPVIRTMRAALDMQLTFDYKQLNDEIDSSNIKNDRHVGSVNFMFSGAKRDDWGVTNASLTLTGGRVNFDNDRAQQVDAMGADTQNGYGRLDVVLNRTQPLSENNSLYLSADGQLATNNLDASEKLYFGGPGTGYDPAKIGGDQGLQGTAELRHNFRFGLPGLWQTLAFINDGYVVVNRNNGFTGNIRNSANLSSVGAGLNWWFDGWGASVSVATPFGPEPDLFNGESNSPRLWAQLQKDF